MKMQRSIYVWLFLLALAVLSPTISTVPQAQSQDSEADDEDEPLARPLPPGVELRVFIQRPRVVKPSHLGTCTQTANAHVNHFELTDWHLSSPIIWSLNRATVPSSVAGSVDGVLNASFQAWSGIAFFQGSDTRAKRARLDHVNAVLWKRLRRSTIGITYVWYSRSSGAVVEVDTVFNKRHPWAIFAGSPDCHDSPDAYDLQNIATHEFGHWLGLDDLYDDADKDLTMYGFSAGGEVKKRTLGSGDIAGKNQRLPSGAL